MLKVRYKVLKEPKELKVLRHPHKVLKEPWEIQELQELKVLKVVQVFLVPQVLQHQVLKALKVRKDLVGHKEPSENKVLKDRVVTGLKVLQVLKVK